MPALPQPDYLKYIPADTPFLFAALGPLPADYAAREYVSRLAAYERVRPAVERLRKRRPKEMRRLGFLVRLQVALLGELGGTVSPEKLAAIGMNPSTVGVLYGLGMNPVVRIRLSDPARFAAVLDRMARRLQPIERAALGSQRYYAARDDAVLWIVAVAGQRSGRRADPAGPARDVAAARSWASACPSAAWPATGASTSWPPSTACRRRASATPT